MTLHAGWSQGRPNHDWKRGIFNHNPHSLEKGGGLKIELLVAHAWVMKPPEKQKDGDQRAFGW